MFEIHDERLGKLKIFNVTEARANFADVLREDNAKVVVTRHGRPTKILISYEEYKMLLETFHAQSHELGSKVPAREEREMPVRRIANNDAEHIVSSLKGLYK